MMRQRIVLVGAGALLGLAGSVLVGAFAFPPSPTQVKCLRYFLIPAERICGKDVYLVKQGRWQWVGPTSNFAPMPKPPAKGQR